MKRRRPLQTEETPSVEALIKTDAFWGSLRDNKEPSEEGEKVSKVSRSRGDAGGNRGQMAEVLVSPYKNFGFHSQKNGSHWRMLRLPLFQVNYAGV